MRKEQLVTGEDYYVAKGRTYRYGEKRVRLVVNDLYTKRDSDRVGLGVLLATGVLSGLVEAHRNLSEARDEARGAHFSQVEKDALTKAYNEQLAEAKEAYFEADPRRNFVQSKYGTSWNPPGVLVREVETDKTGKVVLSGYTTVPRGDIRSTWEQHVYTKAQNDKYAAERRNAAAAEGLKNDALREQIQAVLSEAGLGVGLVGNYGDSVTLKYSTFMQLVHTLRTQKFAQV